MRLRAAFILFALTCTLLPACDLTAGAGRPTRRTSTLTRSRAAASARAAEALNAARASADAPDRCR